MMHAKNTGSLWRLVKVATCAVVAVGVVAGGDYSLGLSAVLAQSPTITGAARHYSGRDTYCKQITGWASDTQFVTPINTVHIMDNGILIGTAKADKYWDATVGNRGFVFQYPFEPGEHTVHVFAQHPSTGQHIELQNSPLRFTCSSEYFYGRSVLAEDTCLENSHLKICFDDIWGGTISGLYNKTYSATKNFVYNTAGGALQFDLRSTDPLITCPNINPSWGKVWNPTQAGCENCFLHPQDPTISGGWIQAPSHTSNKIASAQTYSVRVRPRNYYHHNQNDCNMRSFGYTQTGREAEDIFVNKTVQLHEDYIKVQLDFEHTGDHIHSPDRQLRYRHELPTWFIPASDKCYMLEYADLNDVVTQRPFECKTGTSKFLDFRNSWLSVYHPEKTGERWTIISNTSVVDNRFAQSILRNFDAKTNGQQIDFAHYFSIMPQMRFSTTYYLIPYRYFERMKNGQTVQQFMQNIQKSEVKGALSLSNPASLCTQIRGWASDSSFSLNVDKVRILANDVLLGEVPANRFWDATVGNHGFVFNHAFPPGTYRVEVLAQDPTTKNYTRILTTAGKQLEFSCPSSMPAPTTTHTPTPPKPTNTPIPPTPTPPSNSVPPTHTPTASQHKPGDVNRDGRVDIYDFTLIIQNFGRNNCTVNLVGSCMIDIFDYQQVIAHFGR